MWRSPLRLARAPGIVAVHHMPGWDEFFREFSDRLARHGYTVICPDLYCRYGHGTPDDIAAKVRADGGVPDESVVGDLAAAKDWLLAQPTSNGKVGILGTCSGGRHALLTASTRPGFDAVVDLWGGGVIMGPDELSPARPVSPLDYTADLNTPLLGIFGNDDRTRRRTWSTSTRQNSSASARTTSSTATTAPRTASSTTTRPCTGRRRQWTPGRRYSPSSATASGQPTDGRVERGRNYP